MRKCKKAKTSPSFKESACSVLTSLLTAFSCGYGGVRVLNELSEV